jgi:3'(2'), 5'-bisphosphate nucleotidase
MLLEGKAHAYVYANPGCKKWDTCAPEVILHAAGGKLTDIRGMPFQYHTSVQRNNSGGVLATLSLTHHRNHDWYLSHIPQRVRDALPPSS